MHTKKLMILIFGIVGTFVLGSCGSTHIPYQSQSQNNMSVKEAADIIEELTMTQPSDVAPPNIQITEKYISWGRSVVTQKRGQYNGWANQYNSVSHSYESDERIYFKYILSITIYQKKGWYYVYISSQSLDKYAYYTLDLKMAQQYVDALEVLRSKSQMGAGLKGAPSE